MAAKRNDFEDGISSKANQRQNHAAEKSLQSREAAAVHSEVFEPEALQLLCRRDLPTALRQLADHLDRQEISGSLWSFQGNGMVQDWRREHFLMTLDLAVRTPAGKP